MTYLKHILAGGTAIAVLTLAQPGFAQTQNISCEEMNRQLRAAVDRSDINAQKEAQIETMLRDARKMRRAQNEAECRQKLNEARLSLQQEGVMVTFKSAASQGQAQPVGSAQQTAQAEQGRTTSRAVNPAVGRVVVEDGAPQVNVEQPDPKVNVTQAPPEVQVRQPQPEVIVRQSPPRVTVQQPAPVVTVEQDKPEIIVRIPEPIVTITQPKPNVDVSVGEPTVNVIDQKPKITFDRPDPKVVIEDAEAEVNIEKAEPQINVRQSGPADENVTIEQQEAKVRSEQTGQATVNVQQGEADVNVKAAGEPQVSVEQEKARVEYNQQQRAGARQGEQADANRPGQADRTAQNRQQADQADARKAAGNQRTTQDAAAAPTMQEQMKKHPLYTQRVDEIVGSTVYSERNEDVGDVADVAVRDEQIYLIIGVGGFLGIGEKEVAIPLSRVTYSADRITLPDLTNEQLKQMPAYDDSNYSILPRRRPIQFSYERIQSASN